MLEHRSRRLETEVGERLQDLLVAPGACHVHRFSRVGADRLLELGEKDGAGLGCCRVGSKQVAWM